MMKLDNEMNYNVDHLTMFWMSLSNELILVKNQNMSHEHVILLMNAMLVYVIIPFTSTKYVPWN